MKSSMSGPTASRTALHPRRILADHVHDRPLVAVAQRLVADRHLQPLEALADPELRRGGELLAVEEAEAERGIDRRAVARAAEQPPHRLASAPCP